MAAEVRFKKELLDELLAGQDAKTVFEQDLEPRLAFRRLPSTGPASR